MSRDPRLPVRRWFERRPVILAAAAIGFAAVAVAGEPELYVLPVMLAALELGLAGGLVAAAAAAALVVAGGALAPAVVVLAVARWRAASATRCAPCSSSAAASATCSTRRRTTGGATPRRCTRSSPRSCRRC